MIDRRMLSKFYPGQYNPNAELEGSVPHLGAPFAYGQFNLRSIFASIEFKTAAGFQSRDFPPYLFSTGRGNW